MITKVILMLPAWTKALRVLPVTIQVSSVWFLQISRFLNLGSITWDVTLYFSGSFFWGGVLYKVWIHKVCRISITVPLVYWWMTFLITHFCKFRFRWHGVEPLHSAKEFCACGQTPYFLVGLAFLMKKSKALDQMVFKFWILKASYAILRDR